MGTDGATAGNERWHLDFVTGLELEYRRGKQNCGVRETPAGNKGDKGLGAELVSPTAPTPGLTVLFTAAM